MPADINNVVLVGRLTRDPEQRPAGSTSVVTLRLAVNGRAKEGGDWIDRADFVSVSVFGQQGETAARYLKKGSRVGVVGRLRWSEWQAKDGTKRESLAVVANDVQFLDPSQAKGGV